MKCPECDSENVYVQSSGYVPEGRMLLDLICEDCDNKAVATAEVKDEEWTKIR